MYNVMYKHDNELTYKYQFCPDSTQSGRILYVRINGKNAMHCGRGKPKLDTADCSTFSLASPVSLILRLCTTNLGTKCTNITEQASQQPFTFTIFKNSLSQGGAGSVKLRLQLGMQM